MAARVNRESATEHSLRDAYRDTSSGSPLPCRLLTHTNPGNAAPALSWGRPRYTHGADKRTSIQTSPREERDDNNSNNNNIIMVILKVLPLTLALTVLEAGVMSPIFSSRENRSPERLSNSPRTRNCQE